MKLLNGGYTYKSPYSGSKTSNVRATLTFPQAHNSPMPCGATLVVTNGKQVTASPYECFPILHMK